MAKCLPEIPRPHLKELDMVAHTCNPSTGEAKTGGFLGLSCSASLVSMAKCRPLREPIPKFTILWPPHGHVCADKAAHACVHSATQISQVSLCSFARLHPFLSLLQEIFKNKPANSLRSCFSQPTNYQIGSPSLRFDNTISSNPVKTRLNVYS